MSPRKNLKTREEHEAVSLADGSAAAPSREDQQGSDDAGLSRFRRFHEAGLMPLVVLVVLLGVIGLYDQSFFRPRSLISLLEQSTPLALLAIGQTLVVLTGRIDLANAALASLCGVLLAKALGPWGFVAVVIVLVGAAVAGGTIGWIHVYFQVPSFIVTLGALGIWSGLALLIAQADTVLVLDGYQNVEWIFTRPAGIPLSFVVVVAITLVIMLAMRELPVGRQIKAIGLNERAAAYSGIRTLRVVILVFAASGLLSGMVAVFQIAQLQSAGASTSNSLLLPAIAAVIIGGTAISGGVGGVGRTLLGALVISVLRVGLDIVGVSSAFQPILYGVIVILAIAATVDRRRSTAVA